jgi:tetratricopeptide (TPR) repeat protein
VVDVNAHFINVLMLDRHGNRIDRRNPQDIFTPLYDHQIPPGAANVIHYRIDLPKDLPDNVELFARVRYRKFDYAYLEHVYGKGKVPKLPIVDMCSDNVTLPVAGVAQKPPEQQSPIKPAWQRWNDYGIGCFLEGGPDGLKGGELGQAEASFHKLLGDEFNETPEAKAHGWLNLARVHLAYGGLDRLEKARTALKNAGGNKPAAPWQTVAWFTGLVNVQYSNFPAALENFEQILDPKNRDAARKLDFTKDYVVITEAGKTLFQLAQQEDSRTNCDPAVRDDYYRRAIARFEQTIQLDPENVIAHEYINKCYSGLASREGPLCEVKDLSADEDRLLKAVTKLDGQSSEAGRVDAARDLATLLAELQKSKPRVPVLVQAHRDAIYHYSATDSVWARLALSPAVTTLDRLLLEAIPEQGRALADAKQTQARRLEAADALHQILTQLGQKPGQEDAVPTLLAALVLPQPGLAANLALTGTAFKGHLQGPLPAPRMLPLLALRPSMQQLFHKETDADVRSAAARVLGRMHLVMHGIFKVDENAQGVAVQRYRARHPAAARASQSIVIYPTQPPRDAVAAAQ